jgi:hypothetical protein
VDRVTSMPFDRSALTTGFTSSPVSTKSPVMAALPPPVAEADGRGDPMAGDLHAVP